MIWHKAPVWQNLPHRTINTLSVCRCEPLAHSHQLYTHFQRWSHDNKQYTHADWTERPRVPINQTHGDVLPFCPSSVCMCVCLPDKDHCLLLSLQSHAYFTHTPFGCYIWHPACVLCHAWGGVGDHSCHLFQVCVCVYKKGTKKSVLILPHYPPLPLLLWYYFLRK